jgi:competence protein ComEC
LSGRLRAALDIARAHPRHVVLFSLVAGLLCGGWAPEAAVLPALAGLLVAGRPGVALLAVTAALAGTVVGGARREAIDHGRLPVAIGGSVAADVTLLEPLRRRASGEVVARVRLAGEVLLLRSRGPVAGGPGDILHATGRLSALRDFDRLQRRRGALAALDATSVRRTGRVRGGLAGRVDAVRRRAERALEAGLAPREAALLAGMVLGQDDRIDDGVREAFQASGLAHLLAVSGTNVMLLATLVLAVGALAGAPLRSRLCGALALVVLYVPLTGAGPSIQRAGVMGAAGLVAALAGRPASRWYALGLAAAATLALNPYAAGEPGWQLSFVAVIGLLWLATPLREGLERRAHVPRPVAEAAAITIAASLATAPLLAAHFDEVSVVSLPANLAAAAAVAPIMWLGMLAAAVGQAGAGLAAPLNALNAPLLAFVDGVAAVAAGVPGATVAVHAPGAVGVVAGYGLMAGCWLAVRAVARRRPRRRWVVGGGAAAAAALVALVLVVARPEPPPALGRGEVLVSFLDVGQGDATLVRRDGVAVLFDTGPPGGPILRRLGEEGIARLDALVLTHAQADHEGAALPVVRRFRPAVVVDGGAGWPTPVQRALRATVAAAGGRVLTAVAGDVLRLGPLTLRILWPPAHLAAAPPDGDANDRALVTHVASGYFDVLLTADAESDVTGPLRLPEVDALKVAHHGSEDPGLPAALARLRPQVAAIGVGRGNGYGHPAPSTLEALRAVPHVYRTDRHGTIRLRAGPRGMSVETG